MNRNILNDSLFESIINVMGESVYIVDKDLNLIYINDIARKLYFGGFDVINHSIFEVFPNLTKETSSFVKVFETGKPCKEQITEFIDTEGRRRIAVSNVYPIIKDGEIVGAYEFGEDLTGISSLSEQLSKKQSAFTKTDSFQVKEKHRSPYYTLDSIIGESGAIQKLKEQIIITSLSTSNLFIYGETGSGKELVSQAVYSLSKNKNSAPFVAFNCAAIPDSLLESILFGTVKGSYTGAENKPGLFEHANGGVMFLDEINSMPLSMQAKILRVIEEGKVRRVGGKEEINVDFRLMASTNVSPAKLLKNGTMREDLFYRLNVLNINIPPLRERKEDIPILAEYFIKEFSHKLNKNILGLHQDALDLLMEYEWPGNVRELRNVIDRATNFAIGKIIHVEDLKLDTHPILLNTKKFYFQPEGERVKLKEVLSEIEVDIIKGALKRTYGNVTQAARDLDIPQQTLNSKIDKYGLRNFRKRQSLRNYQ